MQINDNISLSSSYSEKCFRIVIEKTKTHILCSITFFSFQNRAFYEIMWKNTVQTDRPDKTT